MIGHRDCGLTESAGFIHEVAESGSSIQHRVLGVDVQVDELVLTHESCLPSPPSLSADGDGRAPLNPTPRRAVSSGRQADP